MYYSKILLLLALSVALFSCVKNNRYESAHIFHNENWDKNDTAFFKVNITDTMAKYNMYLKIRRSINYPYANIWLRTLTLTPDSPSVVSSDLELTLEEKDGKPTGSRFGNNIEHLILIQDHVRMKPGMYKFWILQNMRDDVLKGVLNINLRIERL